MFYSSTAPRSIPTNGATSSTGLVPDTPAQLLGCPNSQCQYETELPSILSFIGIHVRLRYKVYYTRLEIKSASPVSEESSKTKHMGITAISA